MWQILRRLRPSARYRRGMETAQRSLSAVLAEVPGCWVAIDRATNEAREMAATPYELSAKVRQRGLVGVAIVRAPDPTEPELVGLG